MKEIWYIKPPKLLMEEFQIQEGISMKLTKAIPVAAGMAGGSSDAAAALVGVNRLFRLGLSQEELMKRAVKIGADVPYCVMRGTGWRKGIGEKAYTSGASPQLLCAGGKTGGSASPQRQL